MADKQNPPNPSQTSQAEFNPNLEPIAKPVEKTLLTWKSPARPFKKRGREFFTTAGSIIFLLCIVLVFIKEFLLVMALIAFAFFMYVLNTVHPEEVEHKITNLGIIFMNKFYPWESLGRFWFETKWQEVVVIEHYGGLPTRLTLLLGKQKQEDIKKILQKYLLLEKPELGQAEKMGQWLQEKVPLESNSSQGITAKAKK